MRSQNLALSGNLIAMDKISHWDAENEIFNIETPFALCQMAGYAKYKLSKDGPVLFRGQGSNYDQMRPTLFRNVDTSSGCTARVKQSRDFIKSEECISSFLRGTPKEAFEPLLQHYGLATPWIDLVDNIWSGLWFATHSASSIKEGRYTHYEKSKKEYCYIYMMQFGTKDKRITNGIHTTNKGMLLADLRVAAPSNYLRPHSQHGLLAMRGNLTEGTGPDYSDCVVLVMRIATQNALNWLGDSLLTKGSFMFPPPMHDPGYQVFLDNPFTPPAVMGNISIISA
ncbi:FRG domain protein [Pseudodesulfovibrio hydrargyri]|uniref:FRG domain protein n=1 Tax=Pseudodesulfovibrio hydrargyri TaxID=2125990 RepID=A0A1J5NAG6_9BACT|nr:FRG domain-containing protein [Pseudodesulfovibrio hydrargyri]OIQ51824.1 FRG domain protein [Pseudodesulfovibrio hydrargyri]